VGRRLTETTLVLTGTLTGAWEGTGTILGNWTGGDKVCGNQLTVADGYPQNGTFTITMRGKTVQLLRTGAPPLPSGWTYDFGPTGRTYTPPATGLKPGGVTWHEFGGHRYALTRVQGTFTQAEAEAQGLGGHLVTVDSREENDWLRKTFGGESLWIGLHQPAGSAEPAAGWAWVSGGRPAFTNWDGGQPDNYTGADNFGMLLAGAGGRWHDVPLEGWPRTSKFRGIVEVAN
jgi:hypothetical protein